LWSRHVFTFLFCSKQIILLLFLNVVKRCMWIVFNKFTQKI
jgi:hypothetical protein